jgi:beta-lactam-binding protein with PASTA domain
MPKVKAGSTLKAAKKAIGAAHLNAGQIIKKHSAKVRKGRVIKLSPAAGTVLALNSPVKIYVSLEG